MLTSEKTLVFGAVGDTDTWCSPVSTESNLQQQREAERQAEHLFQTLLHRAFEGEL